MKSNGVYNYKLKNYLTKIVNVYIVYELYTWQRNLTNNFKFKNCLFGATIKVKNSDQEKYVFIGYRITFGDEDAWSFGNEFVRNAIIFGVDKSSSSHSDNSKNSFLVLGEGPTYAVNGNFGSQEKKLSINLTKTKKKLCLSLHYTDDNSCLFINRKEIFKFKADNKNLNFPTQFCLRSISNEFGALESKEVSLNGNMHGFSVYYNSIDTSDIWNIRKYLIIKNNL